MQNPDTGDKLSSLQPGDLVKVLRGGAGQGEEEWVQATVVSNSEAAVAVKYSDDGQEVIPWASGRICGRESKRTG
ncbi:anti-sigma factor RsiW [Phyllobacterium sp. 1468]|uniref:hypothetical protein n=1 Tax=Phyllobacterium sp. 1468 TaxID=2817759 RepID=UPI001AE3EB5A|nr:hypothetical protein [Phyllobacterium sp. 1468]MDR6634972.1 anti-sigma factor RsiW [Phyllobacterium sp. 1468]